MNDLESTGQPLRPCVMEIHRMVCGDCRAKLNPVKPTDPDDLAWYGRCAGCRSGNLIVESEPVYGAPLTGEWHLQCNTCQATWDGTPGDPCWWCARDEQIQLNHQIDLLLTPPDVDPDDPSRDARLEGWADRMIVGIDAGLITEQQAATALRRTQTRRSA